MGKNSEAPYGAHLRAIRSAIAALAIAVIAVPLIMADEHHGFVLFLVTLILVLYSFIPTLLHS